MAKRTSTKAKVEDREQEPPQAEQLPPASSPPRPQEETTWAALAHASNLLNLVTGMGGLAAAGVIWLSKKDESQQVAFHALQSFVFQAVQFLVILLVVGGTWVPGFLCSFVTLGFGAIVAVPLMFVTAALGFAIMIAGLAYSLYGAYQVSNGQPFRYVWVADWIDKRSFGQRPGVSAP